MWYCDTDESPASAPAWLGMVPSVNGSLLPSVNPFAGLFRNPSRLWM